VLELGGLGFPVLGLAPVPDRRLLVFGVALFGGGDQRGVDDLPAHGDVTGCAKLGVEPFEQRLALALVSFSGNRKIVRVGNPVGKAQAQKPHERQPVVDQELGVFVREIVGRPNDQDLEHHHTIERRPPALRSVRIGQRSRQLRAKHFEIDDPAEGQQLIAKVAQPLRQLVDGERPGWPRIDSSPPPQSE